MGSKLDKAIEYENRESKKITEKMRPSFHLTPRTGWMNDPNGFSYFGGLYHIFYQYNPYSTVWGPMHWGHAVSKDLVKWDYVDAAMAPEDSFDEAGCFSGTAIATDDNKHLLIYTGVTKAVKEDGSVEERQDQCIAIGDGITYTKYKNNPVIKSDSLPDGFSKKDFRDPKIWKENGKYYCIIGSRTADGDGKLVTYSSKDAINWDFEKVLYSNNMRHGKMWECPDYVDLGEKKLLIASPQDFEHDDFEFYSGNNTICVIGHLDNGDFVEEKVQTLDNGIDYYAPESIRTEDGRTILIGWMQNWDTCNYRNENLPWFGQFSIPREITLVNDTLYINPIRELKKYYTSTIEYANQLIGSKTVLKGVCGRTLDLTVEIPFISNSENAFNQFKINIAENERYCSSVIFDKINSTVTIDRINSGTRRAVLCNRTCKVDTADNKLKLRLIIDRFSVEVFINDGQRVMSMCIATDVGAEGISFCCDGKAIVNISANCLR